MEGRSEEDAFDEVRLPRRRGEARNSKKYSRRLTRYDLFLFRFMPVLAVTTTASSLPDVGRHYYDPSARGGRVEKRRGRRQFWALPKKGRGN